MACHTPRDIPPDIEIDVTSNDSDTVLSQERDLRTWVASVKPVSVFRIGELPSELIAYIFELYVLDDKQKFHRSPDTASQPFTKPSPLVLISVCKEWRRIAEGAPALWTKITQRLKEARAEFQSQCLNIWLARSGQLPLTIELWVEIVERRGETLPVSPFMSLIDAVNSCSHRWKDLKLIDLPPHFYPLFTGNDRGTPALETLSIRPANTYHDGTFQVAAKRPTPRTFEISYTYLRMLQIDFNAVTEITAWRVTAEDIVEMIRLSPVLEKLEWKDGDLYDWRPAPFKHATNYSLKWFFLKAATDPEENCLRVFKHLTLPALRHFICEFDEYELDDAGEILVPFFNRSRCPLLDIALYGAPIHDTKLVDIFQHLPTIQEAIIYSFSEDMQDGKDSFCRALLCDTNPVLLPALTSLTICVDSGFDWIQLPYFIYDDMINLTRKRPLTSLEIVYEYPGDGPANFLDKNHLGLIRWLRDQGIDVAISIASGPPGQNDFIALSNEVSGTPYHLDV